MRVTKLAVLLFAVIVAAVLALVFLSRGNPREQRLSDGSTLRLEKITYGKQEQLQLGGLLERLKRQLPLSWLQRFSKPGSVSSSSWSYNATIHANDDALFIYVTRRGGPLGSYQNVDVNSAQLVDDDGCVYVPTQAGGDDSGVLPSPPPSGSGMQSSVDWFRFEAFPRRQRKFRVRLVSGQATNLAEFTVQNPAPPPPPTNWNVEPLPITRTNGGASFTLQEIKIESAEKGSWAAWNPKSIKPGYEIVEGGKPSPNWKALDTELYDSTGNFASELDSDRRYLSPREPAWKLRVKFFASEEANTASNAVWTLRGLTVPEPGKFILWTNDHELAGVHLKVVSFAGSGDFTYRDGVPIQADPLKDPPDKNSLNESWSSQAGNVNIATYNAHGTNYHLYVVVGDLTDDQRLTIRAVDSQGRKFYARDWFAYRPADPPAPKPGEIHYLEKRYRNQAPFYVLDLPPDCKTVDLDFCVHNCFAPEYIFKPPQETRAAK